MDGERGFEELVVILMRILQVRSSRLYWVIFYLTRLKPSL